MFLSVGSKYEIIVYLSLDIFAFLCVKILSEQETDLRMSVLCWMRVKQTFYFGSSRNKANSSVAQTCAPSSRCATFQTPEQTPMRSTSQRCLEGPLDYTFQMLFGIVQCLLDCMPWQVTSLGVDNIKV